MADSNLTNKAVDATTQALGMSLSPQDRQQAISTLSKTGDNTLETYVQKIGELRAEKGGGQLNLGEVKAIATDSAKANKGENIQYWGNEQNHPFAVLGQRLNILYKDQHTNQSDVAENSPSNSTTGLSAPKVATPRFDVDGFKNDLHKALLAAAPELQIIADKRNGPGLTFNDLKIHGAAALHAATPALAEAADKLEKGGVLSKLAQEHPTVANVASNFLKKLSSQNHP